MIAVFWPLLSPIYGTLRDDKVTLTWVCTSTNNALGNYLGVQCKMILVTSYTYMARGFKNADFFQAYAIMFITY